MKLKVGDMVEVVREGLWSKGRIGTVVRICGGRVYVDCGFGNHPIFSYNPKSLAVISSNNINTENNKGDDKMLTGKYKVAKIKFLEGTNTGKEYHYALYDDNISVGDYVVVQSAHHGMGIATITDIVPKDQVTQSMRNYCGVGREIIAKFDMNTYNERKDKRKRVKELKNEIEQKMKEVQKFALYEMMAEKDPELKEMLEVYKGLIE